MRGVTVVLHRRSSTEAGKKKKKLKLNRLFLTFELVASFQIAKNHPSSLASFPATEKMPRSKATSLLLMKKPASKKDVSIFKSSEGKEPEDLVTNDLNENEATAMTTESLQLDLEESMENIEIEGSEKLFKLIRSKVVSRATFFSIFLCRGRR